jgi:hypothetical protein
MHLLFEHFPRNRLLQLRGLDRPKEEISSSPTGVSGDAPSSNFGDAARDFAHACRRKTHTHPSGSSEPR